ncbi:hypothetical protein AB832_07855 [Flavobacteriaceae bacterium (ex Bugula neritina AB1)]|nr:hypothetical protein AB832_07855 [Flavobacteriaceae bacterium (ex Bugula neritina AB1)]
MNPILEEARRLNKAGFSVIPVFEPSHERGKTPACSEWRQYESNQTEQDIERLFGKAKGIALICCNGLEVLDIDLKYSLNENLLTELLDSIYNEVGESVFNSLVLAQTTSGGYHLCYRTSIIEGNQKLASRQTLESEKKHEKDDRRVLLETRANGGYIVLSPTDGYTYDNPSKTITDVPTLSDCDRNAIIQAARDFDEIGEVHQRKAVKIDKEIKTGSKSVIQAFNESHTPLDFILNEGWQYKNTVGKNERYVRPGKSLREGHGATYNEDLERFYVFTSSSVFEPDQSYDSFATYAALYHNSDFSLAAKDLYHKGYGDRVSKTRETHQEKLDIIASDNDTHKKQIQDVSKMEAIFKKRLDLSVKPKEEPSNLFVWDNYKKDYTGIAGYGDMITFLGGSKSRKTAISSMACATGLIGGSDEVLMFKGDLQGKNIIHLETEQGNTDHYNTVREMHWQAQLPTNKNSTNFYSFSLTEESLEDKVAFFEYVINKVGNVGYLWLDGIVDLCEDFNDLKESKKLVGYVRQKAAKEGFILCNVLHNAKSTGLARGHLGSFLEEKSKALINCTRDKELGYTTMEFTHTRGFTPPPNMTVEHDANGHLQWYAN